jgi:hypothetical protein
MANMKFRAARVKKKAPRRTVGPPAAKPSLTPHPRLIHGFLVQFEAGSTRRAGPAKPASAAKAMVKARAQHRFATRHEGPADDATFH